MKKLFTFCMLGAMAMSASAQKTVQGSYFFDNWSIGLVGGGITPVTHAPFWGSMRGNFGLEVTKQITPVFGLGLQGTTAVNITDSRNALDAVNVSLLGNFNLMNLFAGYNGKPRVFEIEAVAGAGWARNFYDHHYDISHFTTKYGLNLNFNLGEKKAWTIALKPAIVWNMDDHGGRDRDFPRYSANQAAFELMAGVTYHFKNRSNGEHHFTLQKAYDQAEVDGLNSRINEMRGQLGEKEGQLNRTNEKVRMLEQQLKECRNRKPVIEQVEITRTKQTMESVVTFRQGKSSVDASQLPNVERVATYMRNHPEAKVTIKGYASPEGNIDVNARIAAARAEAVKTILVQKYRIDKERITAEGQGVGDMFSEPDWNRVSICTLDGTK